MKLNEIYEIADGLAPFALSKEYIERLGYHDNSGKMLDCGREIEGALFSLDLSCSAVEEAKARGCNLIFTHHPAIWQGVMQLTEEAAPALFSCVSEGISVLSAHLNLDAAEGGIDECLMRGLGGNAPLAVMERLTGGGYGRVYDVPPSSLTEFVQKAKERFLTERIVVYGDRPVRRVASFCGAGFSPQAIEFASDAGADTLVSSDAKHHLVAEAAERELNVVLLTHYAAECFGFKQFYARMKEKLGIPCFFFADARLL